MDAGETSMENKLTSTQSNNNRKKKCCIYKVPEFIREEKEECYRPLVISIGPIFYNLPQLETMQHLKWICLKSFMELPENARKNLDDYIQTVRGLNQEIRDCYQEQEMPSPDDHFINMIVLDAVFLLWLFKFGVDEQDNLPKEIRVLIPYMYEDLLLEENQLPFFVVQKIFDTAFPGEPASSLINLTCDFIEDNCYILHGSREEAEPGVDMTTYDIAHLLHLWCKYFRIHPDYPKPKVDGSSESEDCSTPNEFPKSAKELNAAGVKFTTYDSKNPFHIKFDNGVLKIPKLDLDDGAEAIFRSILFFEQCRYTRTYFADFIIFLDELVDTEEDIRILKDNEILNHSLGSDKEAANLFNKVARSMITSGNSNQIDASKKVNAYANMRRNQWKAVLKRDYFSHPWAIIGFIFAIMYFVLTVLQTITGFTKNE